MSNRNDNVFGDKGTAENLQPNQNEFFQLTLLAGININPVIIWILIQLLNMKVPPEAVFRLLKLMKKSGKSSRSKSNRLNDA